MLRGGELRLARPLGSYVAENVLFKVAFPAEFHGQTAVEAAFALHPHVARRLEEVAAVEIATQESALRIIDKSGPLSSPADRDHCLQYMVAVALLHGELRSEHYRDAAAADPRIERLRRLTTVREEPRLTRDYLDPAKRAIGNRLQVRFKDGSATPPVEDCVSVGPSPAPRRSAAAAAGQVRSQCWRPLLLRPVWRLSLACGTIPSIPTGSASTSSSTTSPPVCQNCLLRLSLRTALDLSMAR